MSKKPHAMLHMYAQIRLSAKPSAKSRTQTAITHVKTTAQTVALKFLEKRSAYGSILPVNTGVLNHWFADMYVRAPALTCVPLASRNASTVASTTKKAVE